MIINGFTVVQDKITCRGNRVILGHRADEYGHEFVVGWRVAEDEKSWGSGTYCRSLADALEDYNETD